MKFVFNTLHQQLYNGPTLFPNKFIPGGFQYIHHALFISSMVEIPSSLCVVVAFWLWADNSKFVNKEFIDWTLHAVHHSCLYTSHTYTDFLYRRDTPESHIGKIKEKLSRRHYEVISYELFEYAVTVIAIYKGKY